MTILPEGRGRSDQIIEVDEAGDVSLLPGDPGPVPGEESADRRRGLAVPLPEDLADYVRQLCAATKTPVRGFLERLSKSAGFKEAVEAAGQALVKEHVADLHARLRTGQRKEGA